jgi:hypothetical protein
MNTSQKFLRFAAECEIMAQFSHDPENKTVWSDMAERWYGALPWLIAEALRRTTVARPNNRKKPPLTAGRIDATPNKVR